MNTDCHSSWRLGPFYLPFILLVTGQWLASDWNGVGGGNFLICTPGSPGAGLSVLLSKLSVYPLLPPSKHLQQTIISSFHSGSLEATNENENPLEKNHCIHWYPSAPVFADDDGPLSLSLSLIFDNGCQQSESQGRSIMQRCNGLETFI